MAGLESLKSLTISPPYASILSPRIPWEDVCMALSYCSREASDYGRLKYALDHNCYSGVWNSLFKAAMKVKWPSSIRSTGGIGGTRKSKEKTSRKTQVDKPLLSRISLLALKESVSPSCCPSCSGRGKMFLEDKLFECSLCQGIGRKAISDRVRMKFLAVSPWEFKKLIDYNYHNFVLGKTYEWERELINALRRLDEQ